MPLDEAFLVDASVGWRLGSTVLLSLVATNLTDELYFPSADEDAAWAPGRSLGLHVSWRER